MADDPTLFIPVQTFLQLYNSVGTGGYVPWIQGYSEDNLYMLYTCVNSTVG